MIWTSLPFWAEANIKTDDNEMLRSEEIVGKYCDFILHNEEHVAYVNGVPLSVKQIAFRMLIRELSINYNTKDSEINNSIEDMCSNPWECSELSAVRHELLTQYISEEVLYQRALKEGISISYNEAKAYEEQLDIDMRKNDFVAFTKYLHFISSISSALGYELNEYKEIFIYPARIRKLAINEYITNQMEKYEMMPGTNQPEEIEQFLKELKLKLIAEAEVLLVITG